MSEQPFVGYPAQIWATSWQSLNWLTNILATSSGKISVIDNPATNVFLTLLNGLHALNAWQTSSILSTEAINITAIQALSLTINATTRAYFNARVSGVNAAASGVAALVPSANPFTAVTLLAQGKPAIANPKFIEWCMTFNGEPPPFGAFLPSGGQAMASAWLTIANAIAALQGNNPTSAYDTAARQYRCAAVIANDLSALQSGPFNTTVSVTTGPAQFFDSSGNLLFDNNGNPMFPTGPTNTLTGEGQFVDQEGNLLFDSDGNPMFPSGLTINPTVWNLACAMPSILLVAATLASSPATLENQQCMVIRNLLITQMSVLANLLLSLRQHNVTQPLTAQLRNGESLADLAARTTGNFENWTNIANLNEMQPPFPGRSQLAVALSGQQLFISNGTSVGGVQPDPDAKPATYTDNVLGIDWDWGPINGNQLPWTGDIPLISGYLNFSRALGRRLQTSLGQLVTHSNYGCRIPPEVGAIQSTDEASRLNQYGRSAILADPRTGAILQSQATTQPGFLATFSASVQPVGPTAAAVQVSEVIGAAP